MARHACQSALRFHFWLPLMAGLGVTVGCAGPAIRSQSPEIEALAHLEESTKLVGDYTTAWGLGLKRIERAALITGLADTGSDPPPGPQRATLLADMQARGVMEPNRLLASSATALAWAHGYLPPGCRKGDRFDIFVEVPSNHDTTSLAGGWLMETRLVEMAVVGNMIRDGHELGATQGPLLVDPVSSGTLDSKAKLRARLPGGGVSLTDRELGLVVAPEHRSFAMSKRLGDWINRRFHAVIRGAKRGVATPKTDRYIQLEVPPIYRHDLARYIRVVQCVAVIEPAEGRHARLQLLARQLTDPVTAPAAAVRLEAIGKDAIPVLRKGLESKDAEIRFAAAEALAYLGESVAATHLAEAATSLRSARPAALAALGAHPQRPLWASTGVKDPAFPPTMYVMGLVVSGCVNTMPAATLAACADFTGAVRDTVTGTQEASRAIWDALAGLGIREPEVCQLLEDEGVEKFDASWAELLETVKSALADAQR